MIIYVYGELLYSPARTLVNPVNTVGTMGSGLAADFKRIYPEMLEVYRDLCQTDHFEVGRLLLYHTPHKWILNFPVRRHYRAAARADIIEQGLRRFATIHADTDISSISFPALGEDELDWDQEIRPMMEAYLGPLPVQVYIHRTPDQSEPRNLRSIRAWLLGQPQPRDYAHFWDRLSDMLQKQSNFQRLDNGQRFRATAAVQRGRGSLKINPASAPSIFIPETQLQDLWQLIRRCGYVLPRHFPGGLDAHAPWLVSVLGQVPDLQAVKLALPGDDPAWGLHYIPPLSRRSGQRIDLQPASEEQTS